MAAGVSLKLFQGLEAQKAFRPNPKNGNLSKESVPTESKMWEPSQGEESDRTPGIGNHKVYFFVQKVYFYVQKVYFLQEK